MQYWQLDNKQVVGHLSVFDSKKCCYKRLQAVSSFHSNNQVICHYVSRVGDTCFLSLAYISPLLTSRFNSSRSEWTRLHETHSVVISPTDVYSFHRMQAELSRMRIGLRLRDWHVSVGCPMRCRRIRSVSNGSIIVVVVVVLVVLVFL